MANETARMAIPYPSEFEDPWFAAFVSLMESLDGHDFAAFEDRNLFVMGGGTFSWDAGTSTLTWGGDLELNTPSTGNLQTLAAGSQVISDGQMWVVDVSRGASDVVTLADDSDSQLDPSDAVVALCIRRGDLLYFRNGRVLDDGGSDEVFSGVVSSGTVAKPHDRQDTYTGDGSTMLFILSFTKHTFCIPMVFRDGLLLPTTDYTVVGTSLTFTLAPLPGEVINVRYWT